MLQAATDRGIEEGAINAGSCTGYQSIAKDVCNDLKRCKSRRSVALIARGSVAVWLQRAYAMIETSRDAMRSKLLPTPNLHLEIIDKD